MLIKKLPKEHLGCDYALFVSKEQAEMLMEITGCCNGKRMQGGVFTDDKGSGITGSMFFRLADVFDNTTTNKGKYFKERFDK